MTRLRTHVIALAAVPLQPLLALGQLLPGECNNTYVGPNTSIFDAGLPQRVYGSLDAASLQIPAGCGRSLWISNTEYNQNYCVAGGTSNCRNAPLDGSTDLAEVTDFESFGVVSGIKCPGGMGLLGVFLTDDAPGTTPPRLDFTQIGIDFAELAPAMQQVFFVGDGRTSSGAQQVFRVPNGATRLWLGYAYSTSYSGTPCCYEAHRCLSCDFVIFMNRVSVCYDYQPSVAGFTHIEATYIGRASSDCCLPWSTYPTVQAHAAGSDNTIDPANFTYQWFKDSLPLVDGSTVTGSIIIGAQSPDLYVFDGRRADAGVYQCEVSSACNSMRSRALDVIVCDSFYHDQFLNGGGVENLFRYLQLYFAGDPRADINESGAISVQDIFDFLYAYFRRCP